jgi:hypothetical protein
MKLISTILRRPSQRTIYEATLSGLSVLMITSIITPIYIVFFSDTTLFLKILSGIGGISLFLTMFAGLSMTYIQYYTFKMEMGLYSIDKKLLMKLEDAKIIKQELEMLIYAQEQDNLTKLNRRKKWQ